MALQVQICTLWRQHCHFTDVPLLSVVLSRVCSALQSQKVPLFKVVSIRLMKAPQRLQNHYWFKIDLERLPKAV